MIFVQVQFNPWDRRSYTYHYDGDAPLAAGSRVEVDTPKEGLKTVEVCGVHNETPAYETKSIVRVVSP